MIERVDSNIERVLEKLETLRLDNNTEVIIISDNAGLSTSKGWPTSNFPLRAGKGLLFKKRN
jgi:arylsulfatase A-like enzyme